jgi:adenylate kinase
MMPKTVIFMGPQGSGKGTQIALLQKYFEEHDLDREVFFYDTGHGFRQMISEDGYTNELVRSSYNRGELQPDFLSSWLISGALITKLKPDNHMIIDGFPRSNLQAQILDTALNFYSREERFVISLNLDEDIARERLLARGRTDDNEEGIERRLKWHWTKTKPVIDYYRTIDSYQVIDIDADEAVEDIHEKIITAIHAR